MTPRVLIVPAAGLGSRLGGGVPKLLVPVAGVPMIDRILSLYASSIDAAVVVVHPLAEEQVRAHLKGRSLPIMLAVQHTPTGMLDAILLAAPKMKGFDPESVWITWCDQVGVRHETVSRLNDEQQAHHHAVLIMPTVHRVHPYIHLARDGAGRIARVLHRREGDAMPDEGESDMGLFALNRRSFVDLLPAYAREVKPGASTGERNFLPFIAWAASRGDVMTFPATDPAEAIGVNTPDELREVEQHLAAREAR